MLKQFIFLLFLQAGFLFGATYTWTGTTDGNWATLTNWNPSSNFPNVSGDVAVMSGSSNTTIALGADRTIGEIDFNLAAGYAISGGSFTFEVSTGGNAQIVVNAGPNTISSPLTLISPLLITQNSTSALALSGAITGSVALTKMGTGTVELSANSSGSYTGEMTINAGTLSIALDNNLGAAATALNLSGGALLYRGSDTSSRPFSLSGSSTVSTNAAVTATLTGTLTGTGALTITGSNPTTSIVVLTNNNNTYQGGTTISSGTLSISNNAQLGNTSGSLNLVSGRLLITSPLTISRSGTISGNGIIDSTELNTFSGDFSGAGSLTFQGGGTFTLIGSNSYTGGTTIASGTHLSGTTNGIQGNITLNAAISSILTFSQNFDGTYSGALTSAAANAGALNKLGSGTVTFTGSSPLFTGTTTIIEGPLVVNGSLANSPVGVGLGGVLEGSGTVGPTISEGLINPGSSSSVGTLTINGDLTMMSGARTNINIAPVGADQLTVVGNATILGPLQIEPTPGFYGFSADYTILTSAALTGTFSPLATTVAAFQPSVTYTATDALLHVTIIEPFAVFPFSNANTAAVGNNIDELHAAGELSQDLINIVNSFIGQSFETINNALDQMHPAPYSAFTEMQAEVNGQLISLFHRLPYLPCSCNNPNRLWIEGFGNSLTVKRHGLEIGFQANSGGIAFGYDGQITDSFVLGLGGAWTNNHLNWHDGRGHGTMNGLYGGIYFDSQVGSFYFGGAFLAGMDFYDTSRHIKFLTTDRRATAQFEAFDMTGQIRTAYLFGSPQAFFYPYANFDYLYLHTHKFSENGADGLDLTVYKRTDGTLRTEMGLGLQIQDRNAQETVCISPLISIGWVNMCPIDRPKLEATFQGSSIPFKVIGWDESWNLLNLNFGLSIAYRCFSVMLDYNVEFSPDSDTLLYNQNGNLRLDWKW